MPSEHIFVPVDQPPTELKLCSSCQSSFVVNVTSLLLPGSALECASCRGRLPSARDSLLDPRTFHPGSSPGNLRANVESEPRFSILNTRQSTQTSIFDDEEMLLDGPAPSNRPCHNPISCSPPYTKKSSPLTIQCDDNHNTDFFATSHLSSYNQPSTTVSSIPRQQSQVAQCPNPLTDITRLRVRSHSSDCLYPGATFRGTQKSGRNNYDVDVTIVDVNLAASYLCGYLRIRGLTDDHPDLTTYFDAEIIGTRYGFLTRNWGATEQEDLVHWARFPAFHEIKDGLKRPHMKLTDRDRNIVFMRWKERFLIPNHRVAEINGASFAGFYYICVDFNSHPPRQSSSMRTASRQTSFALEDEICYRDPVTKVEVPRPSQRNSVTQTPEHTPPIVTSSSAPVAKMTGFYYHRNSEPYQQLTLYHEPQRIRSSFELR